MDNNCQLRKAACYNFFIVESPKSKISHRIGQLRWQAPALALILVLAHQIIEHTWLVHLPRWQHFISQVLFYGLLGPTLAWWALNSLHKRALETEEAERTLRNTYDDLQKANQRLELLIRVGRRLSIAEDEETLTDMLLDLPREVLPVVGCSLIRFDEQEEPRLAVHRGDLELEVFEAWSSHLSATDVQESCDHCANHWAVDSEDCPLIKPLLFRSPIKKVFCLELERGKRKYGNLNIYLSDQDRPTTSERDLLETLANEMSLAIEGMRLRSRELSTLYYVQQTRKADDIQDEMEEVISHVVSALEISGGILYLFDENRNDLVPATQVGDLPPADLSIVRNLAKSSLDLFDPVIINDLHRSGSDAPHIRALLCAPLRNNQKYIGCLVLWTAKLNGIARRHVRMMSAIATQAALLIENHQLYLRAENHAALAERARLAREIHDGLAQTLAFLQLRTAQINKWLEQGEVERAVNALQEIESLIDEAYLDAREAIDDLSWKPGNEGLASVFRKVCEDFQSSSGVVLTITDPPEIEISVSAQIQLLRIVQEALGNIRKHSQAEHARVNWTSDSNWLTLNISDDGCGFTPDNIPPIAHHGLRIMRERAELLDADLQVISRPGEGTQVIIRMPVDIASRQANE